MSKSTSETPGQSLGKSEPDMPPGTHMPHHRHPTKPLDKKILHCIAVRNGLDGVRKQLDLKTLLRDQPADEKIIGGAVLNGFVAAETGEVGARRDDRLPKSEFDSIQLARH